MQIKPKAKDMKLVKDLPLWERIVCYICGKLLHMEIIAIWREESK